LTTSCEFYYDHVTVTSFIHIKYGDVAIEIVLLWTQHVIIVFLWAKRRNADQIHSDMHLVYGNTLLWSQQQKFCVRKFYIGNTLHQLPRCNKSVVSGLNAQPGSFVASGIQKIVDRWNKIFERMRQYVEKLNTNV